VFFAIGTHNELWVTWASLGPYQCTEAGCEPTPAIPAVETHFSEYLAAFSIVISVDACKKENVILTNESSV